MTRCGVGSAPSPQHVDSCADLARRPHRPATGAYLHTGATVAGRMCPRGGVNEAQMAQMTVAKLRSWTTVDPNAVRDRIRTRLETTPGRLNAYLVALTVLGVLAGLAAVVGAVQ